MTQKCQPKGIIHHFYVESGSSCHSKSILCVMNNFLLNIKLNGQTAFRGYDCPLQVLKFVPFVNLFCESLYLTTTKEHLLYGKVLTYYSKHNLLYKICEALFYNHFIFYFLYRTFTSDTNF